MTRGEHDERYGPEPAVCDTLTAAKIEAAGAGLVAALDEFLLTVVASLEQRIDASDALEELIDDATARQRRELEIDE